MRRAILAGLRRGAASQWVGYIEDPHGGGMARFFGPSSKAGISRKMKNLPLPEFDWDRTMVNLDMAMGDFYSFLHRKPSDVWFRDLPPKEKRVLDGLLAEYKAQGRFAASAKEPWKHWGETREKMLGYAKAEMKRLNVRSPDDLRKARKKHKPSLPSDGSSGQYDAWTETLAQVLEMEE